MQRGEAFHIHSALLAGAEKLLHDLGGGFVALAESASVEGLMEKELNTMLESRLGKSEFLLLQMRINGASTQWIASRLGMSLKWVSKHVTDIDKKLEAMRPHLQRHFGYDKSLYANRHSCEQIMC